MQNFIVKYSYTDIKDAYFEGCLKRADIVRLDPSTMTTEHVIEQIKNINPFLKNDRYDIWLTNIKPL